MSGNGTLTYTRVTKDVGATIKPGPMVVAAPEQVVVETSMEDVGKGSGLNGPLLADLVVAMAAHENMGVNMYRVLRTHTQNPMLQAAYASFEKDSVEAVAVHADLMKDLGIPMYYISPAARMTEGLDSHMIMSFLGAGSADEVTRDMKTVEAVLLASTMCVANRQLLAKIGQAAEGSAKKSIERAVGKLEAPQNEHLEWAQQTQQSMVMAMMTHPTAHKLTKFAEGVVAKVRDKLH